MGSGSVAEGVEGNTEKLDRVDQRFDRIEQRLDKEFSLIHREIVELKSLLGTKADIARLEALEARVDRLERATAK